MELVEILLDTPTKLLRYSDGLVFENGITITDHHDQDCCEQVYADWSSLDDTGIKNQVFTHITIEGIDGVGFRINGFTVHCYNSQNGYYSSSLELIITIDGKKSRIDISEYLEHHID